MDLATDLLVVGSWIGALWFVIRYARVHWRASDAGRNAMAFMVVIALVLTLAVISIFWPGMPGRPFLRLASWGLIFLVIWDRVRVFELGQRDGRRAGLRDNRSATEDTSAHGT
jgi:hypothetical protein